LLISSMTDMIISNILKSIIARCYYLPAARSGILQGHKAIAASVVEQIPYVDIEKLEIPKLSGVVSDFISSIITLPDKNKPFYNLANEFEKELIKGEIIIKTLDEYRYPEIKYKFKNTEISLHRSSSTVSELAPLFLYLKYIIEPRNIFTPRSILIIEEPEAHLHPANQRILAKYLVRLIRKGVNLIITTHSEYLLEQLSSFIMLSKIEPKKRTKKYKYSEEDYLHSDEVGAYVFNYDKKTDGYKISEVEVTEEDGISQEEFIRINESLYEESIRLRKDLNNEK
ncbi:MAG: AAA family ATPase, partial [bacterium]